jgi:signal transduction histidine kinase
MHTSVSYKALGDFEKALEYEILFSDEKTENLSTIIDQLESELQIKYETEKKDETIEAQDEKIDRQERTQLLYIGIAILLAVILVGMYFTIKSNTKKRKTLLSLNKKLHLNQKALQDSNLKLTNSISELKSTQAQLIQSEKMASLGELTAGIAHEIQNPLNFVNNFSEVSNELIDEVEEERAKTHDQKDEVLVSEILGDIKQNLEKINHHGKRADGIVKGMLAHSSSSKGEKVLTNINILAEEYLKLSYHGLRARDKSFNADFKTDFDADLPKLNVVPQDIGRVLLNLINNAFQACNERSKKAEVGYTPLVTVTTKLTANGQMLIAISDNASGIPDSIKDKIFQPFFTTKPTGQGTGLGLSLSYDVVKAHGGELKVESKEGEGTKFMIILVT